MEKKTLNDVRMWTGTTNIVVDRPDYPLAAEAVRKDCIRASADHTLPAASADHTLLAASADHTPALAVRIPPGEWL